MAKTALAALLGLLAVAESYIVPVGGRENATEPPRMENIKRDGDPTDFSWVKRWAAVGDSFTAGIGAGSPLGNPITQLPGDTNWFCSRYDQSYPMVINDALGPSVQDFQFVACSGDRTGGIYNQITNLKGDLDLVIMTAGGNDLCLSSIIKECVFQPFDGEGACDNVIKIAQNNLNSILKPNLVQLMDALNDKMADNSVVVFNGYGQYFNTDNEDCSTKQNWELVNLWGKQGLTLTIDRRKTFNDLVVQINNVIAAVVKSTSSDPKYKFKIGFSNWDPWITQGVPGQYCDPASTGVYPDPAQPELHFFKPNTNDDSDALDELRRRSESGNDTAYEEYKIIQREILREKVEFEFDYFSHRLVASENPSAMVKRRLQKRFPAVAGCPGDTGAQVEPPSIGLPDFIGKNFHPNEHGHVTIASWALQTAVDMRALVLGLTAPSCPVDQDTFTCWQSTGAKAYTDGGRQNTNYVDFCNSVTRPTGKQGWTYNKVYDQGTPDETFYEISLSDTSTNYDKNQCLESMSRIINGCDGNDPKNPMNWKFGGQWVRGDYTYSVTPNRGNRPWPPIQSATGKCEGLYKVFYGGYTIYGAGWASWDFGEKTLEPSARSCVGGGLTRWGFTYFDKPDENGYEWRAWFHTPIWSRRRCFNNNKAVQAAGGFTNGCAGND